MEKRKISFIYRLLVILSLFSGLILNLTTTSSVQFLISYYTMQSNMICLFGFIAFQLADILQLNYRENDIYYVIKGIITIAIIVTGLVYVIALLPNNMPMYTITRYGRTLKAVGNILVHIISPILVALDYFLFDQKGKFKYYYPFIWLCFPLIYIIYVFAYRAIGGRFFSIGGSREFGYFFLDYTQIGITKVILSITCITIGIIGLGFFWVWIDKKNSRV